MPKNYIRKQATDVIFLSTYYRKLIKFLLLLYLFMAIVLGKIFFYHIAANKNNYFLITSFGKLIEINPTNQN